MAASTSGTVGQTVYDVATLIEHAYRRCGKMPSSISGEQILAARESLGLLLTDLSNDGINLWCITKSIIPVIQGNQSYDLPAITDDILSCNYRTFSTYSPVSSSTGTGYQSQYLGASYQPTNAQVSFSVDCLPSLVVESSVDNLTWIQQTAFEKVYSTLPAGKAIAVDISNAPFAAYWRVRDTSGTLAAVSTLSFNYNAYEVPMTPFNRDDYFSLPNKAFQGSKSLQFWFDKQITPRLWVWPTAYASTDQIVVERHRQIQDIGAFTNLIEMPQRWYEYAIFGLACRVAVELPAGELPQGRLEYLEGKAEYHKSRAEDGESDGSPIKVQPNLRGYTR
jgi:hypothetical protein